MIEWRQHMHTHQDVQYLRHKAEQFRMVANEYNTPISLKLFEISEELERMAVELEKGRSERPETRSPFT